MTFEHIPPKSAFNNRPIKISTFDQIALDIDNLESMSGKVEQKGQGKFSLCEKCNNRTGQWYGGAYADWAAQGLRLSRLSSMAPSLIYTYNIFPLRVIKQIICMFFSIIGDRFKDAHPDMVKFVLDKETRFLKPNIRIYVAYNNSTRCRHSGITATINLDSHSGNLIFSEIAFPPFTYVMTIDSNPPDNRLIDISDFSRFSYNDWKDIHLNLPILPIYSWLPGDYRDKPDFN